MGCIRNSILVMALFLVTSPAPAQVVNPLPDAASCYAGTVGTDHTMFIRGQSNITDCDVFGGGPQCLARREFAGDGPNGRPVSLLSTLIMRPWVNGAGDTVAFTEFGFNICLMASASEDTEGCLGRDFFGVDPHTVSISPIGTQLAATIINTGVVPNVPQNDVFVLNSSTLLVEEPYAVQTLDAGGAALQAEAVDFRVDNKYLIVEAFNTILGWGIYAVSRTTGATHTLIAPVSGVQVRNPSLAQTSDDHLVFDAQNLTTPFTNTVYAANTRTGALVAVATTSILSYPSYTGDDTAVVFTDVDGTVPSLASLDRQAVHFDRMTPIGPRTRWLTDGGAASIYRRGTWNGTLKLASECGATCGDANANTTLEEADASVLANYLIDPVANPLSAQGLTLCDVTGVGGNCDLADWVVLKRGLSMPPLLPGLAQICSGV